MSSTLEYKAKEKEMHCIPEVLDSKKLLWTDMNVNCNLTGNSWTFLYFRFEEIVKRNKVEYHAGGSTQNSVKIAQVSLIQLSALCLNVFWIYSGMLVTLDLSAWQPWEYRV